jgi:hypothetical protein
MLSHGKQRRAHEKRVLVSLQGLGLLDEAATVDSVSAGRSCAH